MGGVECGWGVGVRNMCKSIEGSHKRRVSECAIFGVGGWRTVSNKKAYVETPRLGLMVWVGRGMRWMRIDGGGEVERLRESRRQ